MSRTDPDALLRAVGRRVATLRQQAGYTQEQFAERAGFSATYLRRIEGGGQNLSIRSLAKLAKLLDTEVIDLLTVTHPEG